MDEKKETTILVVLIIILVVAVGAFILSSRLSKTGQASGPYEMPTTSKVKIGAHFSIAMSNNLSDGINFGEIEELPAFLNGTANYNATYETLYSIDSDFSGNVGVDLCIRASALNTTAGVEIGLGNYTWSNSTINDLNNPSYGGGKPMDLSYIGAGSNMRRGGSTYYRFWLNISAAQEAGTYNNSIYFMGIKTPGVCP